MISVRHILLFGLVLAIGAGVVIFYNLPDKGKDRGKENRTANVTDDSRPNIVLVYLDDVECEGIFHDWDGRPDVTLPNIRDLAKSGMMLTNFHVTTPVCGPSRACLLSGTYSHTNQFRVNRWTDKSSNGFSGGFKTFDVQKELGMWMTNAGYDTAFVGKFLHDGFTPDSKKKQSWPDIKPPGWKTFNASLGSKYFDFFWFDGVERKLRRSEANEYRTDFEGQRIVDILEDQLNKADGRKPLMLCWAPLASHQPTGSTGMVAPRHRQWQVDAVQPSIDQSLDLDAASQPSQLRQLPPVTDEDREEFRVQWVERLQSMRAVDENLKKIRDALDKLGELENTIFIVTSDHGFQIGHHRHQGKRLPYDRISKVPCIVSGPGIPADVSNGELLANIDLVPTILDLAGGEVPNGLDGKSFATVLKNPGERSSPIHANGIVIENWEDEYSRGQEIDAVYSALRTENHVYTEWAVGDREYYDLVADPEQTNNLFAQLSEEQKKQLWRQLRKVKRETIAPIIAKQIRLIRSNDSKIVADEIPIISLNSGQVSLSGFAEDDYGVEDVRLVIRELAGNTFWNGNRWTGEQATVPCSLDLPKAQITRWTYNFSSQMFAAIDSEAPLIELSVVARDLQGNSTSWDRAAQIKLNVDEPETWLDSPATGHVVNVPLVVTGRAVDNTKVQRVAVVFLKPETKEYWDGTEWTKEHSQVSAEIVETTGASCRWRCEFKGKVTGKLYISARATDDHRVYDKSVASVDVVVE